MAKDFKTGSYTNDKVGAKKIDKKPRVLELITEVQFISPELEKILLDMDLPKSNRIIYADSAIGKSSGVVMMEDTFFDHLKNSSEVEDAKSKISGDYLDRIIENPTILSDKTQKLLDRLNKSNISVTEYFHAEANALTRTPSKRNKI